MLVLALLNKLVIKFEAQSRDIELTSALSQLVIFAVLFKVSNLRAQALKTMRSSSHS